MLQKIASHVYILILKKHASDGGEISVTES